MHTSSLNLPEVTSTLERLFREESENDPAILDRVHAEVVASGRPFDDSNPTRTALLGGAFISVSPEAGRLLYILARSHGSRQIVEFGTSFGISTIYLAAAARDNGGGRVITTELHPEKVRRARSHIAEAGLSDFVEIREGDARETLLDLEGTIDLLFLDGWKSLYLPVLQVVEPRLRPGALVVADDLDIAREAMAPFLDYIRKPEHGFVSVEIPMGDAMEIAVRVAMG